MRRLGILFLGLIGACATTPPVRTALEGNLAQLKHDIAEAQRKRQLDRATVVKLARAVAERELMSASGADGAARVRTLRPCARTLEGTIERRADSGDDVAAELTLMLVEMHAADREALAKRFAQSSSGAFRAVAARALLKPGQTEQRRRFFDDPDERVRRAAFTAAREVHEPGELTALLEAARLDPDPASKSLAASAAGSIGGQRAVLALKDIWAQADDSERIGIVDAWAERNSFVAGGERELAQAAESSGGLAPVSASLALARTFGSEAAPANARLRRYIAEGSDDEKRLAISSAPLDEENARAIEEASQKASPELRAVALARLSLAAKYRSQAILGLRALANQKITSDAERHARDAAVRALARAGDPSVRATLVKDLNDPDPWTRKRAAEGLTDLDDYGDAATALGDDDASLRTDVACTILAREAPNF